MPQIRKVDSKVKKLRKCDIEWSNPCGDQATHFVGYTKSLNVKNFYCNHKKTVITFNVGPTLCISSINKGKTQVRWVVGVGRKMRR